MKKFISILFLIGGCGSASAPYVAPAEPERPAVCSEMALEQDEIYEACNGSSNDSVRTASCLAAKEYQILCGE